MLAYAAMIDVPKEKSRFVRLYEGYQKQMYAVAYRILKDQMLAEDAVQTAFYGIAKNMRSVPSDDEAQIKAYLFTCAKHAAFRIMEQENRQKSAADQLIEIYADAPSAFSQVEEADDYHRLVAAIRQLEPIYRDVLLMHYVYACDLDEIAEKLQRKKKTVKQQITRAKKQLLALYERRDCV